jgi:hypothetical protein
LKPITAYCKQQADGWNTHTILPGQISFINPKEGIHLAADVKDLGKLKVIHASLAPIHTIDNPPTVEELFYKTAEILQLFFGERGFAQQPIDERNPLQRHYFSILKEEEE